MPDLPIPMALAHDILARTFYTVNRVESAPLESLNVYLRRTPLSRGTSPVSPADGLGWRTNDDNILHVFADLEPLANWGHRAMHLFFSNESGSLINAFGARFPPENFELDPDAYFPLHRPQMHFAPVLPRFALAAEPPSLPPLPPSGVAGQRYAILFSGNSHNRHLNDLEFLYRTLTGTYGYNTQNVFVLNYDGTLNYQGSLSPVGNWPGNNTPYQIQVWGTGDRQTFDQVFATVARKLGPNDSLLIHTNNHGGPAGALHGQEWLCGYPNYGLVYTASDFGQRIASLPTCASIIVGMEQCYAGGFMTPTISNSRATSTSFASAVPAHLPSKAGPDFDPWAADWIGAFYGLQPNGAPLKQSVARRPSALQAFSYSNAVHHPNDSPVFSDHPRGVGSHQWL